jgi:hypothetical protein
MVNVRFRRDADQQDEDQQDEDQHDDDAPSARDPSSWFAQQLGEEWQAEEPGIYRHVGRRSPGAG